jgi:hypothetical protein
MAGGDLGGDLMPIGDVEAGLAELLARPLEPPQPVELPPMNATATAIAELEGAAVGAVQTLRWAMAHATDERVRVSAARAVLDAALRRWAGEVRGDPLAELVAAVTVVEPGDGQ